jgi:CRP/FNR family transcriptional regulator, cyclic AMP receptor protein
MDVLTAESLLQQNYLFRGLPPHALARLAKLALRRDYAKGTIVFSQGDEPDALYGVIAGRVRISASGRSGQEVFLSLMEPGDTFGEIAIMDGLPRTASATTVELTTLLVIRREDFLELLNNEPVVLHHVLRLLCQRLRWTSELVEESAFLDGPARVAKRLMTLAALHGRRDANDRIEFQISQEELAHFLGISRQIVNQHLREWQRERLVELGRGRITILDAEALRRLVGE